MTLRLCLLLNKTGNQWKPTCWSHCSFVQSKGYTATHLANMFCVAKLRVWQQSILLEVFPFSFAARTSATDDSAKQCHKWNNSWSVETFKGWTTAGLENHEKSCGEHGLAPKSQVAKTQDLGATIQTKWQKNWPRIWSRKVVLFNMGPLTSGIIGLWTCSYHPRQCQSHLPLNRVICPIKTVDKCKSILWWVMRKHVTSAQGMLFWVLHKSNRNNLIVKSPNQSKTGNVGCVCPFTFVQVKHCCCNAVTLLYWMYSIFDISTYN